MGSDAISRETVGELSQTIGHAAGERLPGVVGTLSPHVEIGCRTFLVISLGFAQTGLQQDGRKWLRDSVLEWDHFHQLFVGSFYFHHCQIVLKKENYF